MNVVDKLYSSFINSSEILTKWDSRKFCKLQILNTETVEKVQKFIEHYDSFKTYYKCFLNNIFITEIANIFENEKEFISCEFEITSLYNCAYTLKDFSFKKCTFYIANYEEDCVTFKLFEGIKDILYSNGNKVIKCSYIEHLSKKYSHDLRNVPSNLLNGISINYSDLTDTILPDNINFFEQLSDTEIHHVRFGSVDFNKYNLHKNRFSNIDFNIKSTLNPMMMTNGIFASKLPSINFNLYENTLYKGFKVFKCSFAEGTIFPNDRNFFIDSFIKESTLPTFDYSKYRVNKNTFFKCSFTDKSILPDNIFTEEHTDMLLNISKIPSPYLTKFILLGLVRNATEFFNKYKDSLSDEEMFFLIKKYNL